MPLSTQERYMKVWSGEWERTRGSQGLTKCELMRNPITKKIVSKRKHEAAVANNNLGLSCLPKKKSSCKKSSHKKKCSPKKKSSAKKCSYKKSSCKKKCSPKKKSSAKKCSTKKKSKKKVSCMRKNMYSM